MHTVLKQVDYDYQRMQYNTVVSGAMKLLNSLEDFKGAAEANADAAGREGLGILLRVLYPACPHICCVLWNELGYASELGDLLGTHAGVGEHRRNRGRGDHVGGGIRHDITRGSGECAESYAAGGGAGCVPHLAHSVTPRKVQMRQMNVPHCAHG